MSCPACGAKVSGVHYHGCPDALQNQIQDTAFKSIRAEDPKRFEPDFPPLAGTLQVIPIEDLKPGDVVVYSVKQKTLNIDEQHVTKAFMLATFPQQKHIILVAGQKLRVMRPGERKND